MIIKVRREQLIKRRIMSGYSQRAFAKKIGISGPYISQIESGERNPSPRIAKIIADGLDASFDDIFFIEGVCNSEQNKSKASTA